MLDQNTQKEKKDDFTFKTMKTCIGEYSLSQFYQHYFLETSQKQDYSLIYWNKMSNFQNGVQIKGERM